MKVKELVSLLQKLNPEALVIVACDSEGNRFSPISSDLSGEGLFFPETSWAGEFYEGTEEELKSDFGIGPDEDDDFAQAIPAVCIWPVN
jgi:hypothetical protein